MVYGSALHGRRDKREPAAIENGIQNYRNRLYYDKIFFFVKTYQNIESITFKLTVVRCCLYN